MKLRAVLFDWDGTLIDSAEATFAAYARLFQGFGLRFERADFERTYSPDWRRTYAGVGLPGERWAEADAAFLRLYAEAPPGLLPGAADAVRRLASAGLALGIVTSGDRQRVTADLGRTGLDGAFEALVCAGDVIRKKPHPEGLLRALSELGVEPRGAAYVGDSPEDVEMARAAGAYAIGVPGGFPNREALVASVPELLAENLDHAVRALFERASNSDAR
ncbi:MAG: HAD family hydrolase [Vicinamibacteria bacterium]